MTVAESEANEVTQPVSQNELASEPSTEPSESTVETTPTTPMTPTTPSETAGDALKREEVSESESDALDTVTSGEVEEEEEEEEDANEVSYEEDEDENLRDFEDNERRLTLEYRLEQFEREHERERLPAAVELHRLPDGNYFYDVQGLPSASRDGTIDAEADAKGAQVNFLTFSLF